MKKAVKEALKKSKELEKKPVPTKEEIISIYKDGIAHAQKLGKLLKPAWFVSEEHKTKVPSGKSILKQERKRPLRR